ncbi:cytidylyltransferase domain-containing protein [Jeotgalibacillus malaysiensis]|uniref:acylneuraminate cytidylyltransferase family protein n=1 Tax=Jeotgalibacillus malaysiensis TaxID=1508404 RepID=UPI0038500C25
MRHIAIIPARSGSKGLKHKNIKLLNEKPLIAYTIEAALKSNVFDEVMVTTDSSEYAEIAKQYGAKVPYLRNEELSSDQASSWDVVRDVLSYYKKNDQYFNTLCLLQPTSPLRDYNDIINAYQLMEERNADSVVSVCETEHSPLWSNTLPEDLSLRSFLNDDLLGNQRQALPVYYRLNGAIYIAEYDLIVNEKNIFKANSYAFIMSKRKSIDIDESLDFKIAEMLLCEE